MTTPGAARPLSRRAKVLIAVGGTLLLLSMLVTGLTILLSPAKKVLVVTMQQDAGESAREQLKADCGRLPGVEVVADKGNRDPAVQGRFPVRFDIGDATVQEETALERCINAHDTVRGFLTEGDR